jgi:YegS/Rv2252/BmrU family lipid kinase
MRVAIILNGISRRKRFFYREVLPNIVRQIDVEVFETQYAQHASALGSRVREQGFDYVLAAGGDGTLHQVLNGVLKHNSSEGNPSLGIIPLGTGNDFARTCGIRADGKQIADLIFQNKPKLTDIGKIVCRDELGDELTEYFINVCSIGMGPEVVRRLLKSDRSLGPLLTYLKAITATFFTHRPQEAIAETKDWQWRGRMRVLAIANGQSFGNQMYIAPDAAVDDGLFSTFIAGELSLLSFLVCLQKIKGKKRITNELIHYSQCASISLSAPEATAIEAEGEWIGNLPAKIEVVTRAIKFLR